MLDVTLFYFFNNFAGRSTALDFVIVFLALYLAYLVVAALIPFVVFSARASEQKLRAFFLPLCAGFLARGVAEVIRFFYYHPRPAVLHLGHQLLTEISSSFPSGHATFFFALSTVVYAIDRRWGIGFFVTSTLIALARIAAGVHYPSDILGGALLGLLVGWAVARFFRRSENKAI